MMNTQAENEVLARAMAVVDQAYRMGSNVPLGNLMGEISLLSSSLSRLCVPQVGEGETKPAENGTDILTIPVVSKFGDQVPIGWLRVQKDKLPPTPNYVFSLGFQALEYIPDPPGSVQKNQYFGKYDLLEVAIASDESYVNYLRYIGAIEEPDKKRRINARNVLNAALHGPGAVIDDLELAAMNAAKAIEVERAYGERATSVLKNLLDAFHEGRLVVDSEKSFGYVNSLVEAGEAIIKEHDDTNLPTPPEDKDDGGM